MLPAVYPLLAASPAVLALIGDDPARVYRHGSAPQDVLKPYVTWSVPGGSAEITLEQPDADTFRVQVDCWSEDKDQIDVLAGAVRAAVEKGSQLVAYIADERDFETKRFRIGFTFDFIKPR
ncbi:DUF3168 domain-containing protein [Variovorax paradoxus]|uniref:DUF3168 domain-containing protein n=1 Tax=Variovorax paradoxus TaxID=34073 RepID=A0A679JC60_VARPD|nr:hypothetical protein VVAX_04329 [Variovorax paradoxus]